jgi:1-acyl-sn-glycerol-3-phosphate acyltransferase
MWLYLAVRPPARLSFLLFFKRIELHGFENIPTDKPILLAANHPTGFIDPCLMAVVWPKQLHFLTRGDMFRKPLVRRILNSLNMIPIFRFRNGFSELKKNAETFKISSNKLAAGAHIMIFAEGTCTHERRLRPIQRGAARMALDTLSQHPALDLHIVPVGIHYSDATRWRTTACIHVCQALPVQPLITGEDKADSRILTSAIEQSLQEVVPHNSQPAFDAEADFLVAMLDNSKRYPVFPVIRKTDKHRADAFSMCTKLSELTETQFEDISTRIHQYKKDLATHTVSDAAVVWPFIRSRGVILAIILGWLPAQIGKWSYRSVVLLTEWLVKNKVPAIEFKNSVRWAATTGLTVIWLVVCLLLGVATQGLLSAFFFSLPVLSYYSLYYSEFAQRARASRLVQQLSADVHQKLLRDRQAIIDSVL